MPITPTYPGVYIEEIPSGVRTITGVATSITAFVGRTRRGPDNEPKTINSFADFERTFGGLWEQSTVGYAVRDSYLNGGSQAIVVRLFHPTYADDKARQEKFDDAKKEAQTAADAVAKAAKDEAARQSTPAPTAYSVRDAAVNAAESYALDCDSVKTDWNTWVERWQPASRGMLKAKGRGGVDESDPCIVSPEARYRGAENQLYRVEIHTGGKIRRNDGSTGRPRRETTNNARETNVAGVPTFKWSRDNGSVTFPIRYLDGSVVTLENLGRDDHLSLKVGDVVEIVDDDYVLQGRAEPLLRVEDVDATTMRVTLDGEPPSDVGGDQRKHPPLRRWDHGASSHSDTIPLQEDTWLTLEDGIQIRFESVGQQQGTTVQPEPHEYRTGDYWLIPARAATGDVEWPGDVGAPEAQPPHGIDHHYAPLAIVSNGNLSSDCRFKFDRQGLWGSDNQ